MLLVIVKLSSTLSANLSNPVATRKLKLEILDCVESLWQQSLQSLGNLRSDQIDVLCYLLVDFNRDSEDIVRRSSKLLDKILEQTQRTSIPGNAMSLQDVVKKVGFHSF